MAHASNAAAAAQQRAAQNAQFMSLSYIQTALANAQNGNSYVAGQALNFDAPIMPGGYLERVVLSVALTVNYTPAATAPTVALNAGGIWNVLNQVNIKFGETQVSIHPYFQHVFNQMRGFNRPDAIGVVGNQNSDIQSMIYKAPTLNSGNNNWQFDIDIPLNAVHPNAVNGLLPISQTGTKVQIQAVPASAFTGADPLNNVVSTNGTISVTGTVTVTCYFRDFKSFATLAQLAPDLSGLATVQTIKPAELNPLTAGSVAFRALTNPYPVVRAVSVVIDGQSSGTFCAASNINTLELDQAENTNTAFFRYSAVTGSGGMARFYNEVRRTYGMDFDDGVLPWFNAPVNNVANPSSLGGNAFLDLTSAGYPAARLGVGVNNVGNGSTITPRVVSYLQILNPQGITLA